MLDNYNRNISYLRISVTDRCNLRCTYCMPQDGIKHLNHSDILKFEEIVEFVKIAISYGINKIRLTGGEPLVRKNIVDLVSMISELKGIDDLAMTTNGILLPLFAKDLKSAGLRRVNISLDSLDETSFNTITRGGSLSDVLRGIDAARNAGFDPIKINAVKIDQSLGELIQLEEFCKSNKLELRYIKRMNLKDGYFGIVEGGDGGNCSICNRIRLTANGRVKPCLFSELEYDIRTLGIRKAIESAINNKPHCGTKNISNEFYNVGG